MSIVKRVVAGSTIAGVSLIASISLAQTGVSESESTYQVPRTEYGQPDLQAVWTNRFNTMLERPAISPGCTWRVASCRSCLSST